MGWQAHIASKQASSVVPAHLTPYDAASGARDVRPTPACKTTPQQGRFTDFFGLSEMGSAIHPNNRRTYVPTYLVSDIVATYANP